MIQLWKFVIVLLIGMQQGVAGDGSYNSTTGDVDFNVHFNFPPTEQQLQDIKASLEQMSLGVCDSTDGQMRVKQIRLTQSRADFDRGNFIVHALPGRSGGSFNTNGGDLTTLGRRLNMYSGAHLLPDVWLHEWGHHVYGLGEQYDEQRRFGGSCGIGPGFDAGTVDERNHSIMQQSGRMQCVGGTNAGSRCFEPGQCPSGACEFVRMSEMSSAANHDLVQGSGTCPIGAPITEILLSGNLSTADPIQIFDGSDFMTAASTSSWSREVEAVDDIGNLPAIKIRLYATRTDIFEWVLNAAVDEGDVGGSSGTPQVIEEWTLTFNADGSLNNISEATPAMTIVGLNSGASDLVVLMGFGTANPFGVAGAGRDGLVSGVDITSVSESHNGQPRCNASDCAQRWNAGTMRFEATQQTLVNSGLSDWETVARNYAGVSVPAGLPTEDPPANCFRAVNFVEDVDGVDQVLLVFDRSGSMAWSSSNGEAEVCTNGIDDDNDGTVDEAQCADSRIDFVRAAGRAFVDLQTDRGLDVGLLSFNQGSSLDLPIEPLTSATVDTMRTALDDLQPGGGTAIGDALDSAIPEFTRVAEIGRSRSAYLLTDGFNTTGVNPVGAADRLEDIGVRIHAIPAGTDVDIDQLNDIAQRSAGQVFAAPKVVDLIGIFAELAARHHHGGLSLPRTNFILAKDIDQAFELHPELREQKDKVTNTRSFTIPVEKGAKRLTAFVSGRNERMREWGVSLMLVTPDGSVLSPGSGALRVDSHYLYIDVVAPDAGDWKLVVVPSQPAVQFATAIAFVDNPRPSLIADVRPRVVSAGDKVIASADIAYYTDIDRADAEISGVLTAPDGSVRFIPLEADATGVIGAEIGGLILNGLYELRVSGRVGAGAKVIAGEPIFDGPIRAPVVVTPFQRFTSVSFVVEDGRDLDCRGEDCDQDGIPDPAECKGLSEDIDSDGIPNFRDTDSDNDQLPDAMEHGQDRNENGVDDACEKGPKRDTGKPRNVDIPGLIDRQKRMIEVLCTRQADDLILAELKKFPNDLVTAITRARPNRQQEDKIKTILPRIIERLNKLSEIAGMGMAECRLAEELLGASIEEEDLILEILK